MSNRALVPTVLLVSSLLLSAAGVVTCSFPEITLATGGSAGTMTSSSTPGGSGGVAGATGTTGGAGGTTSPTGGAGAGGGSSGSGGGTTTSTSDVCPIDEDDDLAISWTCAGGTDCADHDVNTNPGIMDYSSTPIQNETAPNTDPYDKNCDGTVEKETKALECKLFHCPEGKGFQGDVACGASAPLGHCGGIPCAFHAENPAQSKIQRCR